MLIGLCVLVGLIIFNLTLGTVAALILSSRISREEEQVNYSKHQRATDIKKGMILQSLGEYEDEKR